MPRADTGIVLFTNIYKMDRSAVVEIEHFV